MITHSSPTPDDGTTLTEILAAYASAGFDGVFSTHERATVECNSCGARRPASTFEMSSLRRLEGASDPDDMMSVVAITCPACGRQGVLILGFGPSATSEDSDVFAALQDCRDDDTLAGNSAPGEAARDAPNTKGSAGPTMAR